MGRTTKTPQNAVERRVSVPLILDGGIRSLQVSQRLSIRGSPTTSPWLVRSFGSLI